VDPDDPAWLAYEGGASFFLCGPGDPEDFLYRGTRAADGTRDGDQMALISKLAPTGANSLYLAAVRSHGGPGDPDHNPFVDSDPALGLDQDILDQWEAWFTAADQQGITVFFLFYENGTIVWPTGDTVEAEEQAFVESLVDAFEHHDRLIWMVGEDQSTGGGHSDAREAALAAVIHAADDRHHPIATNRVGSTDFPFPDDPNVDIFGYQRNTSTAADIHTEIVGLNATANGRYNVTMSGAGTLGTGAEARRKIWAVALAGSNVMGQLVNIVDTPLSDLEDCGRLREFMESLDLTGLDPHDELAWGATGYVLAEPGTRYVAYGSSIVDEMGLSSLPARTWELSWFDSVSGEWRHETAITTGGGDATFTKPTAFGDEVALYLR
jgi:hypothetical protein